MISLVKHALFSYKLFQFLVAVVVQLVAVVYLIHFVVEGICVGYAISQQLLHLRYS